VKVNQVAQPKLPEVDAEFAKSLGVTDGDVARLKAEVRENIEKEVAKRIKASVKDQVMNALVASASFDLPRSLVDSEVARMQAGALEDLKNRGMTADNLTLPADLFMEGATRRVKLGLLIAELVKRNDLSPKAEQVRQAVEAHAESFEQPEQLVRWFYSEPKRLADVEALVMEDNVVEWALGKMQVSDEKTPFDVLMGTRKA
jgi:trigger factor